MTSIIDDLARATGIRSGEHMLNAPLNKTHPSMTKQEQHAKNTDGTNHNTCGETRVLCAQELKFNLLGWIERLVEYGKASVRVY